MSKDERIAAWVIGIYAAIVFAAMFDAVGMMLS